MDQSQKIRLRDECVKVTTRGNQKQCSAPSLTAKDRQEGAWYLFHVMLGCHICKSVVYRHP